MSAPSDDARAASSTDAAASGTVAVVTGASRGFGLAIAKALIDAGDRVIGIARDRATLERVAGERGERFEPVAADAAADSTPARVIDAYRPGLLVLNAGAAPVMRSLQRQTWETFSENWNVDVRQAYGWCREALLAPLEAGSTVIAVSSLASVAGSPLSGGYASAKTAVRFIASYAAAESERAGLGVRFVSLLPNLTAATDLGAMAVAAYARRTGVPVDEFQRLRGPDLAREDVARAVLDLAGGKGGNGTAFSVKADGVAQLD